MIEEGTWDETHMIRDLWNAGKEPEEIAEKIGQRREYVTRRLVSLERWGEVQRGPLHKWTHKAKMAEAPL